MSNAKIEFSVGSLTFTGEGEEEWVANQLDKILDAAPSLSNLHAPSVAAEPAGSTGGNASAATANPKPFAEPLANYIKAKGGDTNQSKRFLATADWLRQRGAQNLTTGQVAKALADNHQKRLSNPSDCLNKNVARGFCEKTKEGFFITPHGLATLGHQS